MKTKPIYVFSERQLKKVIVKVLLRAGILVNSRFLSNFIKSGVKLEVLRKC